MTENPNQTVNLLDPSINIDDLTPEQVKERILQFLGVPPPRPKTYLILVALDVPDVHKDNRLKKADGTESMILMADTQKEKMSYASCTGMVVAMGPDAYKDERRFPSGPSCKLGEWVTIPRHEGVQIRYRGRVMHWIPDDKIALGIDDPSYVVRG